MTFDSLFRSSEANQPEFLILRFEVQVMHRTSQVFWSFQFAFDERRVDNHLGRHVSEYTCLPRLRIGSKFLCIRSTPTEIQSISENDFECFARIGANAPVTMFPSANS
jgi:hypothetical protein